MSTAIREYPVANTLQPYVETYWHGTFNLDRQALFVQQVMPNGFIELIFHLSHRHCFLLQQSAWSQSPPYTLIGLFTTPYAVQFDDRVSAFGIRFKPEGIYNLFGIPAAEFSASYLDMALVLGHDFRAFSRQLVDQENPDGMTLLADRFLSARLQTNNINYYYLNRAAELIRQTDGHIRMDELVGHVYISSRQLEREFRVKIGITPKQYMRIARMNALNRHLIRPGKKDLTRLTYAGGFSDQSHLVREFKQFAGLPPSKFLEQIESFIVNV